LSRVTIVKHRISVVQGLLGFGFVAAIGSQAYVQIFGAGKIVAKAEASDRFIVKRIQMPTRGEILSSDGKLLAMDERSRVLTVNFRHVPKSRGFYMAMANATGISAAEFAQFASTEKTIEWDRAFSSSQLQAVSRVKQTWRADGVGMKQSGARRYPLAEAGAGLVGFMRGSEPAGGFELMQDRLLRGEPGKQIGMVDRDGQYLPTRVSDAETKQDGKDIVLTINSEIQQRAYVAVKDAVVGNRADQGVAIVMDPHNGDVLAMVSYPSFDPNRPLPAPKKGQRSADFTPAYQAALEPGSTFKILSLAKALDEGKVGTREAITCPGQMMVGGKLVRCDDHGGNRAHGTLEPEDAIARSCNVSAASWALRVGYDRFVPFIQDLGLLRKPNLGLPQEAGGLFSYGEYAKRLQLANLGFGQSINVPPISLASAFCMLANNGKSVTPRLIRKVGNDEQPVDGGKALVRPETAHTVLKFMRSVIDSDHGTGRDLKIPGYELGGKTGTAQKRNNVTGKMEKGGYVASFVGFVPAEKPDAVILVMVDNPKAGKIYGAAVAGPVFVEVAKATIQARQIQPSSGVRMASKPAAVASVAKPKEKPKVEPELAKVEAAKQVEVRPESEGRGPQVQVTTSLAPALDPRAISRGLAAVRVRSVDSAEERPRTRVAEKPEVVDRARPVRTVAQNEEPRRPVTRTPVRSEEKPEPKKRVVRETPEREVRRPVVAKTETPRPERRMTELERRAARVRRPEETPRRVESKREAPTVRRTETRRTQTTRKPEVKRTEPSRTETRTVRKPVVRAAEPKRETVRKSVTRMAETTTRRAVTTKRPEVKRKETKREQPKREETRTRKVAEPKAKRTETIAKKTPTKRPTETRRTVKRND
jgi:cell division protein FtsI/penicillin-binding protein 2